ncbi:hypothetical protein [Legionella hackeliae]|uniref:Zeta toxin domain-containing protein n=1 Tax=Legionella hackeliae TaxID=449 RepID=A0A0A8UZ47_LEGHA|nr:hypothetical protein [Legionella hackeliae]KTD12618.1 hypothetical protein Lhac_1489 [Legionella hackeliae]CEK12034.1 protein of unknown function [Legionella hackeliae]STX48819.1 Uncharacterised protein [Legionella hackeliae]
MLVKTELEKIFKAQQIQDLIDALIHDRIFQTNKTIELLNNLLIDYIDDFNYVNGAKVNETLITSNPMLYLLLATVVENGSSTNTLSLREKAANAYKKMYEDSRFEKHYFYSKSPVPLLTHWLVYSKLWKAPNKDAYDEQMMGIYKGTIAFDKDDIISQDMLKQIKAQEEKGRKGWPYPFEAALEPQGNGTYRVTKWATTAEMDDDIHARLDRLYVAARRNQHKTIMENYASTLNQVSAEIAALMPTENLLNALVVIGPYGSGKTTYTNSVFRLQDKSLVEFSVDALNDFMIQQSKEVQVTRSDYHFEAAILKDTISSANIKNLFVTGAYVDNFRFSKTIDKDYAGRNIRIIEVAPEIPENAVVRLCQREKITVTDDNSTFDNALSTANTGQNTREVRIIKVCTHNDTKYPVEYELICNKQTETGKPDFVRVCSVKNGKLTKHNSDLYEKLTRSYTAKREDIAKFLQVSNQSEINEPPVEQFKI